MRALCLLFVLGIAWPLFPALQQGFIATGDFESFKGEPCAAQSE